MASFFVHDAAKHLARIAPRIVGTLPSASVETCCEVRELEEVSGGWLIVRPASTKHLARITESVTADLATLVVGTVTSAGPPAEAVLARYRAGGLDAVRAMEGNFSAIVVDRHKRKLFAASDCIGTRTLRFTDDSNGLTIAMHDAALVASGALSIDVDHASAASAVLCGWSLKGEPLLRGCKVIGPDYYLDANRDRRNLIRDSFLDRVSLLSPGDRAGVSQVKAEIGEALVSALAGNLDIEQPDRIRFALTAGVDTRAALALLCATRTTKKLLATTTGAPDSIDVKWARRICRALDIEHEVVESSIPTHESFAQNLELLAYVANGDTDGKRALSGPQGTAPGALLLSGLGGEIFRGYYYPYYRRGHLLDGDAKASARSVKALLLRKAFSHFGKLEIHAALKQRVESRLEESLSSFGAYAKNVYAYMDCFYLRERYGVWGALNSRRLWIRSLAPFHSTQAMRLVARIPTPWGDQRIQAEIIQRHLPRQLYWMPVNGSEMLTLHGTGPLKFWLSDTVKRASVLAGRILPQPKSHKSHERMRAEFLAREVYELVHEMLMAPASVALDLMPKQAVQQLLEDHRRKVTNAKALGCLATLEAWRTVVQRAKSGESTVPVQVTYPAESKT